MDIYTIYKATNIVNGKSYIGFDACWPTRQKDHQQNHCKKNSKFYAAIRKHSWNNFTWEVLYQSKDKNHAHKTMEEYFIREYNTHCDTGYGYNMSYGGDGGNRSIETRKKMSAYAKNRSPNHIEKLRQVNLGKKMSASSRKKMSDNNKGKIINQEVRNKISKTLTGIKRTTEQNLKNSQSKLGRVFSEEHKQKLSIARKIYWENKKAS